MYTESVPSGRGGVWSRVWTRPDGALGALIGILACFLVGPTRIASAEIVTQVDATGFPTVRVDVRTIPGTSSCEDIANGVTLEEDGVPVAPSLIDVTSTSGARTMVLVVGADQYSRRGGAIDEILAQARALVDAASTGDRVGLVLYQGCAFEEIPPDVDRGPVESALASAQPFGSAPLVDALYAGAEMIRADGQGVLVYVGDGVENASATCDRAPTDWDGNGSTDDDLESIRSLLEGTQSSFFAIGVKGYNRGFLEDLARATNGAYWEADGVDSARRQELWDASGSAAACDIVFEYQSPRPDPDGTSRRVRVCPPASAGDCTETEYVASCAPEVELTSESRGWLEQPCVAARDTMLALDVGSCAEAVQGTLHVDQDAIGMSYASGRISVQVPVSSWGPAAVVDLWFEVDVDGIAHRIPVEGVFTVRVCDDSGNDTLTVAVADVSMEPNQDPPISIPIVLRGGDVPYIVSYEIEIRFDPSAIEVEAIDSSGSVTESAGWMAPVWAVPEPGVLRVGAAGSHRLTDFGTLFSLEVTPRPEFVGCTPVKISSASLNDGIPEVAVIDGSLCTPEPCAGGRVTLWYDESRGVADVLLQDALGGEIARTDQDGNYEVCPAAVAGATAQLGGGESSEVYLSALDASDILRAAVGLDDLAEPVVLRGCSSGETWSPRRIAADVSGDGLVSAYDASLVLQRLVGLMDSFPAGEWVYGCPSVPLDRRLSEPVYAIHVGDLSGPAPALRHVTAQAAWHYQEGRRDEGVLSIRGPVRAVELRGPIHLQELEGPSAGDWEISQNEARGRWRLAMAAARPVEEVHLRLYSDGALDPTTLELEADGAQVEVEVADPSGGRLPDWKVRAEGGSVRIEWSAAAVPDQAQVEVYDLRGRRLRTLDLSARAAGRLEWRGDDGRGQRLARGVYFVRLIWNGKPSGTRKILLKPRF